MPLEMIIFKNYKGISDKDKLEGNLKMKRMKEMDLEHHSSLKDEVFLR